FTLPNFEYSEKYWTITYGKEPQNMEPDVWYESVPTWELYVYSFENYYVVNARYYWQDHTYDNFGHRLGYLSLEQRNKNYCLVQDVSEILSDVAIYTITIVTICTIITCAIIYATKRKKQKYGF
ncbi:MAG: hypothetical protein K2M64_00435, partial [Clostridia bacterium]|nr:hypothetical protein [Clostridia bacterium]